MVSMLTGSLQIDAIIPCLLAMSKARMRAADDSRNGAANADNRSWICRQSTISSHRHRPSLIVLQPPHYHVANSDARNVSLGTCVCCCSPPGPYSKGGKPNRLRRRSDGSWHCPGRGSCWAECQARRCTPEGSGVGHRFYCADISTGLGYIRTSLQRITKKMKASPEQAKKFEDQVVGRIHATTDRWVEGG